MRRCLLLPSLLLLLWGLSACDKPPAPAQQWHWQMLSAWPAHSAEFAAAERLVAQVALMSAQRLQISVVPASDEVTPRQILATLANGTVQLTYGSPNAWQTDAPGTAFSNAIPFDLSVPQLNAWLSQGGGQALWAASYQDPQIKPLTVASAPPTGGWSKVEIKYLGDLHGLRIASTGNTAELWRRLGANSSQHSDLQRLNGLRRGELEASSGGGLVHDQALGLGQVAAYFYLDWPNPPALLELLANQAAFADLPEDLQAILLQASRATNQELLDGATYSNAIALDELSKSGSQIKQLPAAVRAALQRHSSQLLSEQAAQSELNGRLWASLLAFQALLRPGMPAQAPTALQP
ncbi:ABC transporter substrate-binding protein [Pseudomonas sp. 5P_3.1_Bac2]|uniref:ABC transporter substrate-binding protein n=1 Tax=Pseudomonas sp. 5P_3.1_Bac2 TaxID=2971617 RepID=UPI0021C8ED1E|nr:ABC transporter substrate-binding protein [Pseudomonas sp. 5P_3.1_Bac2]MCU1719197.1 ABC transporter substrate-binding protein [Pseudomonas sp. 5P_3.1_Bac2]